MQWQPVALGAALALAAASKLNGVLGALGLTVFVLVQQGLALARTGKTAGFRYWVDVGIAATVLFVAVNPLLYLRPTERIVMLVQHRQDEMAFQREVFVDQAVPEELPDRIARVARRVFDTYATPHDDAPLAPDVLLVVAGLGLIAWRSAHELRRRVPGAGLLFLCWTLATYGVITVNLGFDSSHYYVPLVALNTVLMGVAIDAGVDGMRRLRVRRTAGATR
jgi:4-amino-4-deoxy-L-arabinose transferase-like glycosyltransferase